MRPQRGRLVSTGARGRTMLPMADPGALDADERALVEGIAERRDELVALLCELIACDTTSRSAPGDPAREEAALQQAIAVRLEAHGADIDLWEPAPEDVAGHPLSVAGIGFAGRPQLAARLRGRGGRAAGSPPRACAAAAAGARCCSTATSTSCPLTARTGGRTTRSTRRSSTATS